jgi:cell division control protein 6
MAGTSFEEILSKKGIFRDKQVLSPHYVPNELLYREDEIGRLMTAVAPALKGTKPRNVFVYGKSGTGKSCCTKKVLQKLGEQKNEKVKTVYMNCRNYYTRYQVLQKAISEFTPEIAKTGYAFALLYEKMLDWVEGTEDPVKGKQLILVLDEVDMVKDVDNLIYTLTRANDDLKSGNVSVIGISNKVTFSKVLDARSKSSLCEEEMVFKPYNAEQLRGILSQRAKHAFEEGVVSEGAMNLAAAIAARENGDARYVLTLLLRAGELAEQKNLSHVSDKEVEQARKLAEEDKVAELVSSLPEHQKIVLYSIALLHESQYRRLIEEGGEKFYFSGEVYEKYCAQMKKMGKEPVSSRWYREYLTELEQLGLVTTIESGKGIRGHTTLIKLVFEAPKIKRIVEKTLSGE